MPIDWILVAVMPALLVGSALFSGAETALFGMSESERLQVERRGAITGRIVGALLSDRRMLLITLMLGNMTVNALYFVVSSVLVLRARGGVAVEAGIALGTLLVIILLGEVLPKMLADSRRVGLTPVVAPLILAVHRVLGPVRIVVARFIVGPLGRLTAPPAAPPRLDEHELEALLHISGEQGVIDAEEQRVIREVFTLGHLRVRDVMTPRVRMAAVPLNARRRDVVEIARAARLARLPVYDGSLDDVVGMLHVKRYLLDERRSLRSAMTAPSFIPQMVSLDQLLEDFRRRKIKSSIVVDEYGGTAGIIAVQDVVEELVGDIVGEEDAQVPPPTLVGLNRWRVSGDLDVRDWAEAFGQRLGAIRAATLGGLILQELGRAPEPGDVVTLANLRIEVEEVERSVVRWAVLTLDGEEPPGGQEAAP